MKLTAKQRMVLKAVQDFYARRAEYPDHHMIAVECGREYCAADWAHAPLRALHAAGLIAVTGRTYGGGRKWGLTILGRDALAQQ